MKQHTDDTILAALRRFDRHEGAVVRRDLLCPKCGAPAVEWPARADESPYERLAQHRDPDYADQCNARHQAYRFCCSRYWTDWPPCYVLASPEERFSRVEQGVLL